MNSNVDEVYMTLLKAKEKIALYSKEKVKNKNWQNLYDGIIDKLDDIIVDYSIASKLSSEEIIRCLFEMGADNKNSIFNADYESMKFNL